MVYTYIPSITTTCCQYEAYRSRGGTAPCYVTTVVQGIADCVVLAIAKGTASVQPDGQLVVVEAVQKTALWSLVD
jgi:hypothetical protein